MTTINDISDLYIQVDANQQQATFAVALDVIADALCGFHAEYFNAQADPAGVPWIPLRPSTVKKKGHPIILIEHNVMRSSVVNRQHRNHIEEITDRGMTWGTDDEKAAFHQEGTARMAQREFVGWSEPAIEFACNQIADAAVEQLLAGIGV